MKLWYSVIALFLGLILSGGLASLAAESVDEEVERLLDGEKAPVEAAVPKQGGAGVVDRASIPDIFVAVDMVGGKDLTHGRNSPEAATPNGLIIRSAELGLSAGIDQLALGTVNLAVHEEEGEYLVELHEALLRV